MFFKGIYDKRRYSNMGKATLVIMAAGIGSRFGGGIKQLEPVGPNGEIIMDYSIHNAIEAGYDRVVFVIRKSIEKEFKKIIGSRIEKKVKVDYAYQELNDIPEEYLKKFKSRTKPWGTGQAILCCKGLIEEPFLVINADDYYGNDAFNETFRYLSEYTKKDGILSICMVGFILKNTLSDNGGVTRGICKVDENRNLTEIVETQNIIKISNGAQIGSDSNAVPIDVESEVSMNMWGLVPEFFDILKIGFTSFLEEVEKDDNKTEYLLPTIIGNLLEDKSIEVKVLKSNDKWFGITYKEDKESAVKTIRELVSSGTYASKF